MFLITIATIDTDATLATFLYETTADELLCDKNADGNAVDNIITKGTTFTTLCTLLESGPWTLADGSTVDILDYIASDINAHTIFAPTDAAFAKIQGVVDGVLELEDTNSVAFNNIVANWLQLHILPDTYLLSDFNCDETYSTLNLADNVRGAQKQKTKCRGQANYFAQIGGGNVGTADQPTVGLPSGVFPTENFGNAEGNTFVTVTTDGDSISSNVIGCNGVIHVVDSVLQPGGMNTYYGYYEYYYYGYEYYGTKGAKTGKKGKYGKGDKAAKYEAMFNRLLKENQSEESREEVRENRRARLESLIIDANGNTEPQN
jgi:uncharacterized surface protein with fasciclin (FAS1) repeats